SDDLNQVYLEIVAGSYTVTSEKLLVNYSPVRPNLHVLSIGTETNLQYTLKDARDFARLFSRQDGDKGNRLFNKISIDTLFGRKATASEIKGTIEELKIRYYTGSIGSDDVVLAFISSHGFLLDGDFRIQGDDYSPARQRSTSVSFKQDVAGILKDIPCKKILLVDACHSGGARANPADINFAINQLNNVEKGLTVFASSSGEEQSYEDPAWQNGAFTEAILSGLRDGKADADGNRIVSLHELYRYVSSEVAAIVKDVKDRPQHPMLVNDELGDVAIYVMDQKNEP
ncbi:MAG TPA: caspase family protein, partial [Cyclobacteriaceae bacterium]